MKKKQLFSLRKLSVGIASVSLGTLVFLGGAQAANAEDAATTQADKDAQAVNAQVELAKKAGAELEAKENTQEQVDKAQAEINALNGISKETKDIYNKKVADAATADIPGIVQDAKAVNAQVELAQNAAKEQEAQAKAARELNTLTQVAYNTVNNLHNLTDQQKEAFVKQIKNDSANNKGQNLKGIVTNARQLDTNNVNEKHAREAGANTGLSQDVAEKVKKAHNEVDALKNLTPEQKAAAHSKLNDDARNNVNGIDKVVKDAKALDAKQAPKKDKEPKKDPKNQNVTTTKEKTPKNQGTTKQGPAATTGNGKVAQAQPGKDQTAKVTTEQKTGQNLAQAKVTKDEAKAQQKAEAAKKQLPETGEQDQVLFGMLAGTLFASAGTLFLVQVRRKENE